MRSRRRAVLGVAIVLVAALSLGPLIVGLAQMIRTPPPQHPGVVAFELVGEALERLAWSLGFVVLVLVVRAVLSAVRGSRARMSTGRG